MSTPQYTNMNDFIVDMAKNLYQPVESIYNHKTNEYYLKTFTVTDGLELVIYPFCKHLLNISKKKRDELDFKLRDIIERAEKREGSLKNEILELKKQLNEYKRYYGEYTSPFDILNKLFIGAKDKEYLETLSILNPKTKLGFNTKATDYWLAVLEDLGITRRIDRGRYMALTSFKEANNKLHAFINKSMV